MSRLSLDAAICSAMFKFIASLSAVA